MGEAAPEVAEASSESSLPPQRGLPLPAQATGYLQDVDAKALLQFAEAQDCVVRMERAVGEFVVEGSALVSLEGKNPDDAGIRQLNAIYTLGRQRTMEQDAAFGIRQIVDVALKALSPGINDTTTAIICIDYLGAILARLASRQIESDRRAKGHELRVIARGPTFSTLLSDAFDQIRQNAEKNPAVLVRLLEVLTDIASRTDATRRAARQSRSSRSLILEAAMRGIPCQNDRQDGSTRSRGLFRTDGGLTGKAGRARKLVKIPEWLPR